MCSSEAEASHLHSSASRPSSWSDDGSSVDSDDSIQLEAKESVSSSEIQGGAGVQPQAWLFSPARAGGAKGAPFSGTRTGGRPAFPLLRGPEAPLAPPRISSRTVSAGGAPTGRRNLYLHKDPMGGGVQPLHLWATMEGGELPWVTH